VRRQQPRPWRPPTAFFADGRNSTTFFMTCKSTTHTGSKPAFNTKTRCPLLTKHVPFLHS
jgi:hypothetical protein